MRIGAFTDKGKARDINEDCFFVSEFNLEDVFGYCIVADGMGGHNAGEIASSLAIEEIKKYIKDFYHPDMTDQQVIGIMNDSMSRANKTIYDKSLENQSYNGMGTTAIACIIYDKKIYIAHVGDSRAYLIHESSISQITTDHSMIEELINSGSITREEAQNHPQKNIITRALGGEENIPVDIHIQEYSEGDMIIMCTDGLSNMLTDLEILSVLKCRNHLQSAVEELISIANDRGGLDNITVVALEF
ncbi:MAG: Stp1/IreP family PP2C-type Ser/Thr phosphatase [Clostridia bacterium]